MANSFSLYELTVAHEALSDSLDTLPEGTDPEQWLNDELNKLEGAIEKKVAEIGIFVKTLEADEAAIVVEEKRLRERRVRLEKKQEFFERYVKTNMEAVGLDKVKTPLVTVSLRKCPASVEVVDEAKIPQQFIVTKIEKSIDKCAIMSFVEEHAGEVPDGVNIITNKKSLQIK